MAHLLGIVCSVFGYWIWYTLLVMLQINAYPKDADSGPKLDSKCVPFNGMSDDFMPYLNDRLLPHVTARVGYTVQLGLAEALVTVTTDQDKIRIPALGGHGGRSLHTFIGIKKEPKTEPDAAALMQAKVQQELRIFLGTEAADEGTSEEPSMLQFCYPARAKAKRDMARAVFDRFEGLEDIVAAIPSEGGSRNVTVAQYEAIQQMLLRLLLRDACTSVKMTVSKLDVQNGFELLQLLLLKHAPKSTDRTVGHMNTLRMTYVDARRADIVGNHSDWADKLVSARMRLGGMSDKVFYVLFTESYKGSGLDEYMKQVLNTTPSLDVDTVVQEVQDRSADADVLFEQHMITERAHAEQAALLSSQAQRANVHKAIAQIECQMCGGPHGAKQCPDYVAYCRWFEAQRSGRRCNKCGRAGHSGDACRACWRCGGSDHRRADCPHEPDATGKPPAGYQCPFCKTSADHYSKECPHRFTAGSANASANKAKTAFEKEVAAEATKVAMELYSQYEDPDRWIPVGRRG